MPIQIMMLLILKKSKKSYNTEGLEEFINGKISIVSIVSYHTGVDDKFDW